MSDNTVKELAEAVDALQMGENEFGDINLPTLKRVIALKTLQAQCDELTVEYKTERFALEEKYRVLKQVFYDKRTGIVNNTLKPDEFVPADTKLPETAEQVEDTGVESFWLQALGNHPAVGQFICEDDVPLLQCLTDIKCDCSLDYKTFTLSFFFKENDYFTNTVLTKAYTVAPDILDDKSPELLENKSSEIDWKAGKSLLVTEVTKKQKAKSGKNKGQVRTITKTEPKPSFFHYFSEPADDDDEDDDEDDEMKDPIKLNTEEDYDIGHAIRTQVIPEAISWFTNENGDDEDEDYEPDEDGEDDEDDDEDDDDEEEEVKPKKGKGGAKKGKGGAPGADGQGEECKQS